jgi:hypothetical protein
MTSYDILFLLEKIVIDFDAENDAAADGGDEVRDEQRPQNFWLMQDTLKHEANAAHSSHQECG